MTLGQRIQEGRAALGLSQEGLGEKLGVSRQAVSKWEADAAVPDTDKLIALSRLFEVTLNRLLQVEEPADKGMRTVEEESREPEGSISPLEKLKLLLDAKLPEWRALATLGTVLLLIIFLADFRLRISHLENRVEVLEYQAAMNSMESSMDGIYTSSGYGVEEDVLSIDVSPKWELDGLEVFFDIVGADAKNKRIQGEKQENGDYAVTIWLGDLEAPPYTVLAEFSYKGRQRTESVLRLERSFGKWVCE